MSAQVLRVVTEDGSWTLKDVDRGLTYRSTYGAQTESDWVFVDGSGLDAGSAEWRVLELGLGAAMNFHRTRLRCEALGRPLSYTAVERSPVDPRFLEHGAQTDAIVRAALSTPAEEARRGEAALRVHVADWADLKIDGVFDAIYHDPFAPSDDPESWTVDCFARYARHAHANTVLVTYSVAGTVRRALSQTGWTVEKYCGPPGKREVLRAIRAR